MLSYSSKQFMNSKLQIKDNSTSYTSSTLNQGQMLISNKMSTKVKPADLLATTPKSDEAALPLLDVATAATELRRQNGDVDPMVLELYATPVGCTTPN